MRQCPTTAVQGILPKKKLGVFHEVAQQMRLRSFCHIPLLITLFSTVCYSMVRERLMLMVSKFRYVKKTPTIWTYTSKYALSAYNPETESLLNNPAQSQLYNATKFSGRTRSKLGIGILNAVAAPSFAKIQNKSNGKPGIFKPETSPITMYLCSIKP
jgi:Domain of unknown function (DUF5916)